MKQLILLSLMALMLSNAFAQYYADVYLFWGDGCGYCAKEKPFLEGLQSQYPQLNLTEYEVWHNSANREYFLNKTSELGISSSGVPVTIIGSQHWIGYASSYDSGIIAKIEDCIANGGCGKIYVNDSQAYAAVSSSGQITPALTIIIVVSFALWGSYYLYSMPKKAVKKKK